ncbi:MAG: hypothetical protein PUE12_17625 [Oscillospiraceae bacterium]|nr:hypothetical protein [Oscillospiraceae bacterium]
MKKYYFILKITITLMLITIASLAVRKTDFLKSPTVEKNQSNLTVTEEEKNNASVTVKCDDTAPQTTIVSSVDLVTYDLGESCETEEWLYSIHSVGISKSSEGMIPFPEGHYKEDEKGNLICDSSFIIADMEITNNSSSDRQLYMNSTRIDLYNYQSNNITIDYKQSTEACAYTFNADRSIYAKDFFLIDFKAGETKSFRIGYVINDDDIIKDFDIIRIEINHSGMAGFNDNIRYYKIGEKTNLKDLENVQNISY